MPMLRPRSKARNAGFSIALVALPDVAISTLTGIYEVMGVPTSIETDAPHPTFRIDIVGETAGPLQLAGGLPIMVQGSIDDIEACDIVIVPSVWLGRDGWDTGRYPRVVDWIRRVHARGAVLCSACSGIFLLAESGLFDQRNATVHFGYARQFAALYPEVSIAPERALVISGDNEELVSSGASTSWHDLVLYLVARYAGATDAQALARMFALQWHQDGLASYISFEGRTDHDDAEIRHAQQWLGTHFSVAHPVDEIISRSRLAERTFKRRFTSATGMAPIEYVQRLRIEDAKRRLERTAASVEEIGWKVGYESDAFFRRLFKRITGMSPNAYRKKFRVPEFARS